VGKTTLLKQLLQELRGCSVDGFVTEELQEDGQPLGVWLSCVDGRQALLAHRDLDSPHRVGAYHVNVELLDELAVTIIRRAMEHARLLFLDELGKVELCSLVFQEAVEQAFRHGPRIVATGDVASLPFLDGVKHRKDVELIPLSKHNWSAVQEELMTRLRMLCETSEPVHALQGQMDRISAMIASGAASCVDIEIQQTTLRERLQQEFPDQPTLYYLWCEQRFRRLWQQFRHG